MHADRNSTKEGDVKKEHFAIDAITGSVIACAHEVSNSLGCGFLEKVYENALAFEIRRTGLRVEQQRAISVRYKGEVIGEFAADLLVADAVIVELKSARVLDEVHTAQCINYLRATGLKVCLLLNFGRPRVEVKRVVLGL
jgi:GxxExxY protein